MTAVMFLPASPLDAGGNICMENTKKQKTKSQAEMLNFTVIYFYMTFFLLHYFTCMTVKIQCVTAEDKKCLK